jgi:Flp pilus assembly protein TadG
VVGGRERERDVTRPVGRREHQRGVALMELAIAVPLIVLLLLGVADLSRLVSLRQEMSDLCREAANLVSRGGSPSDAMTMMTQAIANFGDPSDSGIVISRVKRRDVTDSTPWVVEQVATGTLGGDGTTGTPGGPAQLPAITSLAPGVTIMVVELIHGFHPLFATGGQGFYPPKVREVAVF